MNCTSFTDMNSRINAIESKVKKIHLPSVSRYILVRRERCINSVKSRRLLFLFQVKVLEEGRWSLPTVNSLPEGSTHNEVDTPKPTPIGPPLYLPPGISSAFKLCCLENSWFGKCVIVLQMCQISQTEISDLSKSSLLE